jgi:NAD(P)-dependent dehydrogenase (short-subunit alcohol dehydrogenase family)
VTSPETAPRPDRRFAERVALVTGASRGIGLAVAARIVAEGGRVVITARKPEGLTAALDTLGPDVARSVAGRADDAEHQGEAVATAVREFGRLDVLVNNTGINPVYGPLTQVDEGAARKIIDVNVLAALSWTRRALDAGLGAHPDAAVVNVASVAGLAPAPGIAWYGVSKSALIGLTVQLAAELAPDVRVNAVAPAVIKTKFAEALYAADEAGAAAGYPLRRLGEPADVGAAVAFLASSDAGWITGQTLVIDGGGSLRASL